LKFHNRQRAKYCFRPVKVQSIAISKKLNCFQSLPVSNMGVPEYGFGVRCVLSNQFKKDYILMPAYV